MRKAQEVEYQLPSSQRGNRKDFFKGLDDDWTFLGDIIIIATNFKNESCCLCVSMI